MKELDRVEEKEKVAAEIKELVKQINQRLDNAPFLKIRFNQSSSTWVHNPRLEVEITETITY